MSSQQSEFGFRPRFIRRFARKGLVKGINIGAKGIKGLSKINKGAQNKLKTIPSKFTKFQKRADETGLSMFIPTKKATAVWEGAKRGPKIIKRFFGFGEFRYERERVFAAFVQWFRMMNPNMSDATIYELARIAVQNMPQKTQEEIYRDNQETFYEQRKNRRKRGPPDGGAGGSSTKRRLFFGTRGIQSITSAMFNWVLNSVKSQKTKDLEAIEMMSIGLPDDMIREICNALIRKKDKKGLTTWRSIPRVRQVCPAESLKLPVYKDFESSCANVKKQLEAVKLPSDQYPYLISRYIQILTGQTQCYGKLMGFKQSTMNKYIKPGFISPLSSALPLYLHFEYGITENDLLVYFNPYFTYSKLNQISQYNNFYVFFDMLYHYTQTLGYTDFHRAIFGGRREILNDLGIKGANDIDIFMCWGRLFSYFDTNIDELERNFEAIHRMKNPSVKELFSSPHLRNIIKIFITKLASIGQPFQTQGITDIFEGNQGFGRKRKVVKRKTTKRNTRKIIKIVSITRSPHQGKKLQAKFEVGGRMKTVHFGAKGMSDFTKHKDKERRERYIKRHLKDLRTGDPTRAGYLSMYVLWNKPTLKASIADYKKRVATYNRTGRFPRGITGSKILKN